MKNEYSPDSVTHPGETIKETLIAKNIPCKKLAEATDRKCFYILAVLNGTAPIVYDFACTLEQVLGIPKEFWMERQRRYGEYLAQKKKNKAETEK